MTNDAGDQSTKVEILSLLYSEKSARASLLSDRQYSVTLQVVTLHVAVVAAIIAYQGHLTPSQKVFGGLGIAAFDEVALGYVYAKSAAYWSCQRDKIAIEAKLRERPGWIRPQPLSSPSAVQEEL